MRYIPDSAKFTVIIQTEEIYPTHSPIHTTRLAWTAPRRPEPRGVEPPGRLRGETWLDRCAGWCESATKCSIEMVAQPPSMPSASAGETAPEAEAWPDGDETSGGVALACSEISK